MRTAKKTETNKGPLAQFSKGVFTTLFCFLLPGLLPAQLIAATYGSVIWTSKDSINFGNIDVGGISDANFLTLVNKGNAPLSITGITASDGFIQKNTCSNFLPAGDNCLVNVKFVPTVSGVINGSLVIKGDAKNAPFSVSLTGTSDGNSQPITTTSTVTAASAVDNSSPGVVLHQDFNAISAGTVLTTNQIRDLFSTKKWAYIKNEGAPRVKVVADPANSGRGKVFQVSFPKGSVQVKGGGAQWVTRITASDEYYFAYDMYVPKGFNWPLISKLPGLFGGDLGTVTGGKIPDGIHGWQARQGMYSERKEGETSGYSRIGNGNLGANPHTFEKIYKARYNYALANKWDNNSARLVPGKWIRIEQHVKLNTATSRAGVGYKTNGIYEAWVNGVKVSSRKNLAYRIVDSLKIDGVSFVWYYGGKGKAFAARENQAYYFDNFTISTKPISH